jgi:hypothetical protein
MLGAPILSGQVRKMILNSPTPLLDCGNLSIKKILGEFTHQLLNSRFSQLKGSSMPRLYK